MKQPTQKQLRENIAENEKYPANDYASWLGIFYNRSPQDEFYYYEAPMPIYPLQEDTDKLKTEA
jgi:hypothetical protein